MRKLPVKKELVLPILLLLILAVRIIQQFFTHVQTESGGPLKKPLTVQGYKAMKLTEHKYRLLLETLDQAQVSDLSEKFHRNITFHWGGRFGLLPAGKSAPFRQCVTDYLHSAGELTGSVSVVMCYKNELITKLLRTLTLILLRTPEHLLTEILLIDDASDVDSRGEIEEYCRALRIPTRILRNTVTMGIANARHYGIQEAVGEIVVILDSHMEVSELWLEPLLDTLSSKPGGVAVPAIHLIHDAEYEQKYQYREPQVGPS